MKCAFCNMLSGEKSHRGKNFPFLVSHETRSTVSFLSIDFPAHEDGHTLVIPKKHFTSIVDIPKKILNELIEHSQKLVKIIRKNHSGANILVNEGKFADQTVFHTHFHIIPRDRGDLIKIHRWKEKKMSKEKFLEIHEKMKRELNKQR